MKNPLTRPGLFFVRASDSERLHPTAAEIFGERASLEQLAGDPDEDGRRWVDIWFDRGGAEELARRWEQKTTIAVGHGNISGEISTVAEVVSVDELLAEGGYEAVGRALAAVQDSLAGRLKQFEAGVRFGA